ncbi:hypothetical protein JWG39_13220 [Desulforhopalus vacuolatus]|uniref:hypothetical protein n=1 Tax=Desulforhopalus vacuolatus TaxID=40414 RepID=UPI001963971D|nr:hypothetical protein [Desulforhopalus vacuolatus]MBM9520777.1 hypothetical protein [Desulforhopalus vacuolatus]
MENRHGGGFPRCCCVDKACLVSTVAVINEMVIITDNPQKNTRYVITTGTHTGCYHGKHGRTRKTSIINSKEYHFTSQGL